MTRAGVGSRFRSTVAVARLTRGQCRVPYLSEERVRELRDARVRKIVAYADDTVPFYRELFASEDIDPRELRTADDLERLPVISKAELWADPTRFLSTSPRARDALLYETTGTTGFPVKIWHDRRSLLENMAFGERERVVEVGFVGKRVRYSTLSISRPAGAGTRTRAFYRRSTRFPIRPARHSFSVLEPLERAIEEINRLEPDVIRGFGSYLELLFHMVSSRGIRMHVPKLVVYGSDLMTPAGRLFIEREFGVPVISRFAAVECLKIGFFCEERRGFHLHEDLCHVTIVDGQGRSLADGEQGQIVISNLVNHGTVILGYLLADLATISTEPCSCGRSSRVLTELDGRSSEILHLPDGSIVQPDHVYDVVRAWPDAIKFQLVQLAPEHYELKLVTKSRDVFERIAAGVVVGLRELLHGAAVEATYHELESSQEVAKLKRVVALGGAETIP